jgi:hypothetical protein
MAPSGAINALVLEWGLSERLVRVELRRRVFVHELITPGLLHLVPKRLTGKHF